MFDATAGVYDLVYEAAGKDYAADAAQVAAAVRARCPGARSLLEVGCGTGAYLAELRPAFPDHVAGLDLAPAMLARAAARPGLDGVELRLADMRDFDLGRCFDAVVCLFSAVGYAGGRADLDAAVGCMARHLSPGGVLVVDGWVRPGSWRDPGTAQALAVERDGTAVARVARSWRDGDRTTIEMHHLIGTLDGVEHVVEEHVLTLFDHDAYAGAFAAAGLEAEVVACPYPDRDRYVAVAPG